MATWCNHFHRALLSPGWAAKAARPKVLSSANFTGKCFQHSKTQLRTRVDSAAAQDFSAKACSSDTAHSMAWQSLGAGPAELTLDFTLPTGQSFRWRQTGVAEFTGVVDNRVVKVQQRPDDIVYQVIARGNDAGPSEDAAVLRDYFNLQACLAELCQEWSSRDARFKSIYEHFPGARVLRQDPVECLFEFICSSNNHISRIHGMVERLCRDYGTPILHSSSSQASNAAASPAVTASTDMAAAAASKDANTGSDAPAEEQKAVPDLAFYSFPTLEQLSAASEAALRAEGFGYRAKFIAGTVKALLAKPGGGRQWLYSLRDVPYREASEALCELPGIGPKVAACICLFALDKHEAIPVDTHVWQLAVRYYTPHLKGKTMNKKIMVAVEDAFIERFGPWAGWAHNTLFISELASQRERLPEHLQPSGKARAGKAQNPAKPKTVLAVAQSETIQEAAVQKRGLGMDQDAAGDEDDSMKSGDKGAKKGIKQDECDSLLQPGLQGIADSDSNAWQPQTDGAADMGCMDPPSKRPRTQKPPSSAKRKQKPGVVKTRQATGLPSSRRTRSFSVASTAQAVINEDVKDAAKGL